MTNLRASHQIIFLIPFYIVFMSFSRGFYNLSAFYILLSTFILFTVWFLGKNFKLTSAPVKQIETGLFLIAIFSVITSFFFVKGFYQPDGPILQFNYIALIIVLFLTLTFTMQKDSKLLIKYRFAVIVLISIVIKILIIVASPHPAIDVFDSLKKGGEALLEGKNPYNIQYGQVYKNVTPLTYFPYPPGSLLFLAPTVFLFKDPRVLLIMCQTFTSLLFFMILRQACRSRRVRELVPILYLYFPMSFFIIEQSWLDPLAAFLLSLFAYLNLKYTNQKFLKVITLGLTIIVKQYLPIILLFLLKNTSKYLKIICLSTISALIILLLFYLPNPDKFNVFRTDYPYRFDALTLIAFMHNNFGIAVPKFVIYALWGSLAMVVLRSRGSKDYQIYLGMSYWLLGFFFISFIAFVNEYYLSFSTLILSYTLSFNKPDK